MQIGTNLVSKRLDAHVVPNKGLWAVKVEGNSVYSGIFQTKIEATSYAINLARLAATSVVLHNKKGVIHEVWSYDHARHVPRIMQEV